MLTHELLVRVPELWVDESRVAREETQREEAKRERRARVLTAATSTRAGIALQFATLEGLQCPFLWHQI